MITDPMLAMFCLGLTAGTLGGAGLRGWWLARHSAILNESVRQATVALYGRRNLHALGRRDRAASRAAYDEEAA